MTRKLKGLILCSIASSFVNHSDATFPMLTQDETFFNDLLTHDTALRHNYLRVLYIYSLAKLIKRDVQSVKPILTDLLSRITFMIARINLVNEMKSSNDKSSPL